MFFTEDNLRYCLLSWSEWEAAQGIDHGGRSLPISGLFNWANVFKGKHCFPRSRDDFAEFNLVHMNVTAENLNLVPKIRRLIDRSKTALIFNVDYAIEMWAKNFRHPELLLSLLDEADYIFAVEPAMADALAHALRRAVPCIPHPSDTAGIKAAFSAERDNQIGVAIHRYDWNIILPYLATRDLNEFQTVAFGGINEPAAINHLYDFVAPYRDFDQTIKMMSRFFAIIETYTIHSYGRTTIEAAALGVPVIGSEIVASQRHCFPELTVDIQNPEQITTLIRDLSFPDFYGPVSEYAKNAADHYSFDQSRSRMLDFLNSSDH